MAIENLKANQGIYKALSKLTKKDYYKTETGVIIKTDKGKGSVSYNKETGEITCDGLQNAIIEGTIKADKITVQNSKNVKAIGGLGNDEFNIKFCDTVEINGGLGKDEVILYDNPMNVKLKSVEHETHVETPSEPPIEEDPNPTIPPTPTSEPEGEFNPSIPPAPTRIQRPTTIPTPEPTTPKEPERDGIIDGFKQGDITDSKFFSQLISMSQTEAGAQIIKESITWDDENRKAIVHCKGLGVDVTISYDELQDARENGLVFESFSPKYGPLREEKSYSSGDDDILLLELALNNIKGFVEPRNVPFMLKCADNEGAFNPYTFLAGVKYDTNYIFDPREINNILKELEEDNGQKLVSNAVLKFNGTIDIKDVYGNIATLDPKQTYAIKEIKDGLVTIINPQDATGNSPLTQTFTYKDFCERFNVTKPVDITKASDITPEIHILEDSDLEYLLPKGVTPTTAKIIKPERNGEIERSAQGGIGDCWFLSQINAMSYSEAGRKIIKEAILWDDENQQAIVHCKGLGIDMVVSYDELAEAEKNGNKYYHDEDRDDKGGAYSKGDDDVFLLEYVMSKLDYLEDNELIDFEAIGDRPSLFEFLAGVEIQPNIYDEVEIKKFLDKLEADGCENIIACAATPAEIPDGVPSFFGNFYVTDANGKEVGLGPRHAYAIKEVKNGLVTVVNPWDSSDDSKYTATFTYEDFCKYFYMYHTADISKPIDKTPKMSFKEGVNLADYGIIVTTGNTQIIKRDGEITVDSYEAAYINKIAFTQAGAKIIKDAILWDDKNRQATVHCKGLGIDITVSYDELENARNNSLEVLGYSSDFLPIDDDVLLLQYVSQKIAHVAYNNLVTFDCSNKWSPGGYTTFLTGAKDEHIDLSDEAKIKEFLDRLEADNGKNLFVQLDFNIDENGNFTDFDTCERSQIYAIKEVKDGYVTIASYYDSTDVKTFTYDEFCDNYKYVQHAMLNDFSKPLEKTPEIIINDDVNLSDYGITVTTGILKDKEGNEITIPTPEPTLPTPEPSPEIIVNPDITFTPFNPEPTLPDFNPRFFGLKDGLLFKNNINNKYRTFEE